MFLLAIADILFVTTPWLMYFLFLHEKANGFCTVEQSWSIYEYVSTVTITQNRWMPFFMAFKRFLCLFSFRYALHIRDKTAHQQDKTTWKNWRNNLLLGFFFGLIQGCVLSTIMYIADKHDSSQSLRYIMFNVHPVVTTTIMAIITVLMVLRLSCCRNFRFPIPDDSKSVSAEFRRAIIVVTTFFILAQAATIVYFFDRQRSEGNDGSEVVNHFYIRWICLVINSSVNFFIYCATSSTFRERVKKLVNKSAVTGMFTSTNAAGREIELK